MAEVMVKDQKAGSSTVKTIRKRIIFFARNDKVVGFIRNDKVFGVQAKS